MFCKLPQQESCACFKSQKFWMLLTNSYQHNMSHLDCAQGMMIVFILYFSLSGSKKGQKKGDSVSNSMSSIWPGCFNFVISQAGRA